MKGGVGLGDKGAYPGVDFSLAADDPPAFREDSLAQIDNGPDILNRFRRVTDHEIEFDARPTMGIDGAHGFQQLFGLDRFIDDAPHPLGGSLWSQGKTSRRPRAFELVHQVHREKFRSAGRAG